MKHFVFFLLLSVLGITSYGQTDSAPVISVEDFISGLDAPVDLKHAGDERLFVLEQHQGEILIFNQEGEQFGQPFLTIEDISTAFEQGLLCMAFHPEYQENGEFFVYYTNRDGDGILSRFSVSEHDPNSADPASEEVIMTIDQPYDNHNGATIAFGPDGMLYFTLGDGGSGGDPQNFSQNPQSWLGKILRLDVDSDGSDINSTYAIPDDNPFVDDETTLDEIWALGVRNPWRCSFDSQTGDFWIADVGQSDWEEINFQPASSTGGENYGWRCYEGTMPYNTDGCREESAYVFPVHEYENTGFNGQCSVTGGFVYRGTEFPELQGHYVFGDWCSQFIWSLFPDGDGSFTKRYHTQDLGGDLNAFGQDHAGELYVCLNNGMVKRIVSEEVDQSPYHSEPHEVPGVIQAQDFDLGGQGLAYSDNSNVNQGSAYRQDEFVDIEHTTDERGDYNIHDMESGEWLEYAVNVAGTGEYDVRFRLLAPEDGGVLTLEHNNTLIGDTVEVTSTQNEWQTISMEDITLEEGEHVLRMRIHSGGFKFNYMEIIGIVTNTEVTIESTDIDIYPSPFQQDVFIDAPQGSMVSVTNHAGVEVFSTEVSGSGVRIGQDFTPGLYMINVMDGEQIHRRKVIKSE